jgi:hypothetical protein
LSDNTANEDQFEAAYTIGIVEEPVAEAAAEEAVGPAADDARCLPGPSPLLETPSPAPTLRRTSLAPRQTKTTSPRSRRQPLGLPTPMLPRMG